MLKKYRQNHPEVNRKVVKNYVNENACVRLAATVKYEKKSHIRLMPSTTKYFSGFKHDPQIDYSRDKGTDLRNWLPYTSYRILKCQGETPDMYFSGGKVQFPALETYPELLHSLLAHHHPKAEQFLYAA